MLVFVMQFAFGQQNIDKLSRINKIVVNDRSSVTISADNGEPSISYEEQGSKPYRVKEGVLFLDGASSIEVTVSNLSQLEVNDAATVAVNGGTAKGFEVVTNDASTTNVDCNLDKVVVVTNDASTISLTGSCNSLNITSNDASMVSAGEMRAEYAVAKSYDASSIIVNGVKNIDTQINDMSNIEILKEANDDMEDSTRIIQREIEIDTEDNEDVYVEEGDLNFGKDMDKWSKKKLKWRPDQRVWSGIELSMVGLSDKAFDFGVSEDDELWKIEQPSVSLHINIFEHKFKLGTEHLKFVSGFGLQWDFLRFKQDISLLNTKDSVQAVLISGNQEIKKNTLVLAQMQIPLLLNINTNPGSKRNFHIDGGVVVGYRFAQRLNQEFDQPYKTDVETKVKSQFHQNPFDFSATVRLGVGSWSVFGMYDLGSLYKKDEGPGFKVWNVGLTIIPF